METDRPFALLYIKRDRSCECTREKGECMKRKFAAALSGALMLAACAFGLAACGERPHEHSLQHHDAVAATCTQEGTVEYWSCEGCGKNFSDEGAAEELTSLTVPALGHAWDEGEQTTAPTCTEEGVRAYTCTRCTEQRTEPVAALGHTWDEGKQTKAPTCKEEGVRAYTCTRCEAQRTEPIAALGHIWGEAWLADDVSHWHMCTRDGCGARNEETAHTYVNRTCTECLHSVDYTTGLEYSETEGGLEMSDIGSATDEEITVPAQYNGKPVVGIGAFAFSYPQHAVTKVCLPASIVYIGQGAFSNMADLRSIEVAPDSALQSIGEEAFRYTPIENADFLADCPIGTIGDNAFSVTAMTELTLPASLTEIGWMAFSRCASLERVTFADGTHLETLDNTFYGCDALRSVDFGEGSVIDEIGEGAFISCDSLTEIGIPDGVARIGVNAFESCAALERVIFGENSMLSDIGERAFAYCTALSEITIPQGVTQFPGNVFLSCAALQLNVYEGGAYLGNQKEPYRFLMRAESPDVTSCTVHEQALAIVDGAFKDCASLTGITFNDTVMPLGTETFAGSGLTSVTFPETISSLGDGTFRSCEKLAEVTFTAPMQSYGNYAFQNCSSLTTVTFPSEGIVSLGSGMFANCTALTSVARPSSLSRIEGSAFSGSGLQSVVVPASVTEIESFAFSGCKALTSLSFAEGSALESVGMSVFDGCSALTEIALPESLSSVGYMAFQDCTALETIVLPSALETIGDMAFYHCILLREVEIPSGVTSFGQSVFARCFALERALFAEDSPLTTLPYGTFNGCFRLEEVILPDNLLNVDGCAFSGCTALTEIALPDCVTQIDMEAFKDCENLTVLRVPASISDIWDDAFTGSGLRTLIIPAEVSYSEWGAFANLSLEAVCYCGTQTEWESRGNPSLYFPDEIVYFYSEEQPEETGNYWHYDADGKTPVFWQSI